MGSALRSIAVRNLSGHEEIFEDVLDFAVDATGLKIIGLASDGATYAAAHYQPLAFESVRDVAIVRTV